MNEPIILASFEMKLERLQLKLYHFQGWWMGGTGGKVVCTCYKKDGFVVSLGVFFFKFSTMDSVEQRERALFPCSMRAVTLETNRCNHLHMGCWLATMLVMNRRVQAS